MTRRELIAAVTALIATSRGTAAATQQKSKESQLETVTLVVSGMT